MSDFSDVRRWLDGGPFRAASDERPRRKPTPVGRLPPPDLLDHILIIRALMLREAKLKHLKMGLAGRFIDLLMPTVVITVHYFVFLALDRVMPSGIPIELFVLTGFTTWFVFRNTSAKVNRNEDLDGTILIPGVTPLHFLIAGCAWECATMTFMLYGGLFFCALVLGTDVRPNVPFSLMVFATAAGLGTGYRLIFDSLAHVWPLAKAIKKPLTWFVFLTSGIYFAASKQSSSFISQLSLYDPLTHLIEPQRAALWPGYPMAGLTVLYPISCAVLMILAGFVLKIVLRPWFRE